MLEAQAVFSRVPLHIMEVLYVDRVHRAHRLLHTHDSSDVALQPDAVLDELRQLRVYQRFVLLEGLPCRCKGAGPHHYQST